MEQPANWVMEFPSPDKYPKVAFEKYDNRTLDAKIPKTHLPRFKPIVKNTDPSPATYKIEEAVTKTQWVSTKYTVGHDKTPRNYFDESAKKNKSPGPGTHPLIEQAFDKICKSPRVCKKRH